MDGPKKNDVYRMTIEGYASAGEGVARLNGQAVFVKGALKGEICDVQLLKAGKTALWGKVRNLVKASPERQEPDCPYFPKCGGCQTRHMSYPEELAFKRRRVEDALKRIGGVDLPVSVIYGSNNTDRYRNKAQFPVSQGETAPRIGFYRARSHDVMEISDCLLQPKPAARLRVSLLEWMERYAVPAYDETGHRGLIRHLYVRVNAAGQSLCAVVANGGKIPRETELVSALRAAEPGLVGIVLAVNETKTNVILGERYRTLWGQDYLEDTLCGLTFRLSVPSFYQVNREQAEVLYDIAVAFAGLSGNETVLDLYCGIGTITLAMAKRAGRVIGAEVVPQAVEDARQNAARNGVSNAQFLCADAGEAAGTLAAEGVRPDVICVDPPRKGLSPDVIDAIAALAPDRLVYVSCDPATLARDIKLLGERSFSPVKAAAVDLFPRTHHVETVVQLSRKTPDDIIHVDLDLTDLPLTKAEAAATYTQIKEYVMDQTGLKVSSLYVSQVKRKCGLEVGDSYNKSKNEEAKQPQCPPEKETAIMAALRHYKMIG